MSSVDSFHISAYPPLAHKPHHLAPPCLPHPHSVAPTRVRLPPTANRGMSLTRLVAANAAAAAAGAGKKAAQVQLQAELNTDDEWNKFLNREGLLGKC